MCLLKGNLPRHSFLYPYLTPNLPVRTCISFFPYSIQNLSVYSGTVGRSPLHTRILDCSKGKLSHVDRKSEKGQTRARACGRAGQGLARREIFTC